MSLSYQNEYQEKLQLIEAYLDSLFTQNTEYAVLLEAMRYSLLAGGKRIRPVLCLAFAEALGADIRQALPAACAVELVHTYSLIHDDLPCMDNDDYRRGRLTCHKVYGDDLATLAGDALLTAAFSLISSAEGSAVALLQCVRILSEAAGEHGMVAGQVLDLQAEGKVLTEAQLRQVHRHKTGDMIRAACTMGTVLGGGSEAQLQAASEFAYALGLAFQIRDDMLDEIGSQQELGKRIGSDAANEKCTYVTLLGLESCQSLVESETEKAVSALKQGDFGDVGFLQWLAESMVNRKK